MTRPTPANPKREPDITWRGHFSLDERETMIREAAYYHYQQRGYAPGHDMDDWLAAEAELEHDMAEPAASERQQEANVQLSGMHGAGQDDEMKRITKQHPRKAIPQMDSVEPKDAPLKE